MAGVLGLVITDPRLSDISVYHPLVCDTVKKYVRAQRIFAGGVFTIPRIIITSAVHLPTNGRMLPCNSVYSEVSGHQFLIMGCLFAAYWTFTTENSLLQALIPLSLCCWEI